MNAFKEQAVKFKIFLILFLIILLSYIIIFFQFILTIYILHKFYSSIFDFFSAFLSTLSIASILVVFAVFGPIFIDRSISYHIILLASNNGSININKIEELTSRWVYKKRIEDALNLGLLEKVSDEEYKPTKKAIGMSESLIFIGKITNSLHSYSEINDLTTTGLKQ